MTEPPTLQVDHSLAIPRSELRFQASRSSGPGGQHVNKVETRATVAFDVAASPSLDEEQRQQIQRRLASRINRQGELQVSAQRHRSQSANRLEAEERLVELLREALTNPTPRKPTRASRRSRQRRLEAKRQRSAVKRQRNSPRDWD